MDKISKSQRSLIMSKVHSKDTAPEMIVRSLLHRMGYRFRLHQKVLPGKPDIVLPKYKTIIEIRGCFWHRHEGCQRASTPKSNTEYWQKKFENNIERDQLNEIKLKKLGWKVIIIWECEVKNELFVDKIKNIRN